MPTTFIGVDLAWQTDKHHTGIVVLSGDRDGATLLSYSTGITTLQDVQNYILANTTPNTVIAIDAPLIINNPTSQRPCETQISTKFGRYHASAHTSNLTRFPQAKSVQLAQMLERNGFTHKPDPANDKLKEGCCFFEVYPHPAQVVLFNLDRIIKYKKGRMAEKRAGLELLRHYMRTKFVYGKPAIHRNKQFDELLNQDMDVLKGKALKHYEDSLDALVCAYIALYYWAWGGERNELIGDLENGYIITPTQAL